MYVAAADSCRFRGPAKGSTRKFHLAHTQKNHTWPNHLLLPTKHTKSDFPPHRDASRRPNRTSWRDQLLPHGRRMSLLPPSRARISGGRARRRGAHRQKARDTRVVSRLGPCALALPATEPLELLQSCSVRCWLYMARAVSQFCIASWRYGWLGTYILPLCCPHHPPEVCPANKQKKSRLCSLTSALIDSWCPKDDYLCLHSLGASPRPTVPGDSVTVTH